MSEWEDLVLQGIEARQKKDSAQWELGDLALTVERIPGESTLERYAEDIGIQLNTLEVYRWVADTYEKLTRIKTLTMALGASLMMGSFAVGPQAAAGDTPNILVFRKDTANMGEFIRGFSDELYGDFDVVTFDMSAETTSEQMCAAISGATPEVVVLMDNPTVSLYRGPR